MESIIRKIRADGWAKNADERAITEEALRAVRTAFPELSATEAAAAVRRLKRA